MSGWTPNSSIYNDVRQSYKDNHVTLSGTTSDSTANYLAQIALMGQQYDMSDAWWNEHDSPEAITEQLKALGYSDAFIAQVLSGGTSSNMGASPVASGGSGSGAVSNTNGAISNLVSSADSVTRAVEADTAAKVGQSQITANNADAVKTLTDAGLAPEVAASEVYKNVASGDKDYSDIIRNNHLNALTDEETKKVVAETGLTWEQCKNYELQNEYYVDVTEQELRESEARCTEYFSRVKYNIAAARERETQSEVNESQIDLNEALEQESIARAGKEDALGANLRIDTQNKTLEWKQNRYEFDYMIAHDGVKLDDDTQQRVTKLIEQGKIDEAEKVCLGAYKYHAAVKYGNTFGSWRAPSKSIYDDASKNDYTDYPHFILDGLGNIAPSVILNPSSSSGAVKSPAPAPTPKSMRQTWNPNDRYDAYGNHWVNGKIVND